MPNSATLAILAEVTAGAVRGDPATVVGDVHHDSRATGPGDLFVAVRGFHTDGHDHAATAVSRGAAAVCVEHPVGLAVPQLLVADTRAALAPLAAEVHGHPARRLTTIGVTGTNGKTTVSHFIESIGSAAGSQAGLVGTLGGTIAGEAVPLSRTTPEASDLQRLLARMVAAGVDLVALEVSSHALVLHRADAIVFDVAVFTNLSQDHLDFHGDLESYFAAKMRLFERHRHRRSVVWVDDRWGRRLLAEASPHDPITVGMDSTAAVHAADVEMTLDGSRFRLMTPSGAAAVRVGLAGDFNVANALLAAAAAWVVGVDLAAIAAGLERVTLVPGRFETISAGDGPTVVVDYAHTPAGVASVVAAARAVCSGRLVVVLGAGGDRDEDKRPLMGQAAAAGDTVVVTSDNPRSEDPARIVAAVAAGAEAVGAEVLSEPDRRAAISLAVHRAGPGDVVLVLGKGHEQGQEFADRTVPFDDRAVAREELAR